MRTLDDLTCPECQSLFVNFSAHCGCPQGHGKLHRFMDLGEVCLTIQTKIPVAEPVEGRKIGRYCLNGNFVRVVRSVSWRNAAKLFESGQAVAKFEKLKTGLGVYELVETKVY